MNKLFKFFAILVAVLLSACGGGGGFSGTPTGPSATLRVFPMVDSISLPVGASGSTGIEVQGGQKPYVVISSDASVSASISEDNILLISGNSSGTSTLSIQDQNRQEVKITVTATVVPLASSVGTSVNMKPSQSRTFTVRGGAAPYIVSSSDTSVATVSGSGGSYTITSGAVGGTATIHVLDSSNTVLDITVTVATVPLVVSPSSISGVAGSSGSIQITGGAAPYQVTSSNTAVVSVSGSSYSLVGAGAATLNILDNAGQTAAVTVTVTAAAPSLKVAPATQTVQDDGTVAVTYLVSGGTKPYSFVASPGDADVTTVTVDNTANSLKIAPAAAGKYCSTHADRTVTVDVYDSVLAKQTVTLLIKHAAASTCP